MPRAGVPASTFPSGGFGTSVPENVSVYEIPVVSSSLKLSKLDMSCSELDVLTTLTSKSKNWPFVGLTYADP